MTTPNLTPPPTGWADNPFTALLGAMDASALHAVKDHDERLYWGCEADHAATLAFFAARDLRPHPASCGASRTQRQRSDDMTTTRQDTQDDLPPRPATPEQFDAACESFAAAGPEERAARLERACLDFPPLAALWQGLAQAKVTTDARADVERVVLALYEFTCALPLPKAHQKPAPAVTRLAELIFALHDIDQGGTPALLAAPRTPNRQTDTSEHFAKDQIGAVLRFVRAQGLASEGESAEEFLSRSLKARGAIITPKRLASIERGARRRPESTPDMARPITSIEELRRVLDTIAPMIAAWNASARGNP
jgi:hypothetical protein